MISLAECAPCKAMRLQAEAEEEFRKRYGVVNAKPAGMMGWKPYLGQAQPQSLIPTSQPASTATPYEQQVQERLLNVMGGGLFGFPVGILGNVAFKSLRRYRDEAAVFAAMAAGVGVIAAFLPIESRYMNSICRISGFLSGSAVADVALPKKAIPLPA